MWTVTECHFLWLFIKPIKKCIESFIEKIAMIFIYIFITGLPVVLLFFELKKMITINEVEKNGITQNAVITYVKRIRHSKGSTDNLTLEYKDSSGTRHMAKITTQPGNYLVGTTVSIKYLGSKPAVYGIDGMQPSQWVLIITWMLLLAFTIYASIKIDALLQTGNYHF